MLVVVVCSDMMVILAVTPVYSISVYIRCLWAVLAASGTFRSGRSVHAVPVWLLHCRLLCFCFLLLQMLLSPLYSGLVVVIGLMELLALPVVLASSIVACLVSHCSFFRCWSLLS